MNIAEILKYCPKGTKLYCTLCGNAEFGEITNIGTIVIRKVADVISTSYTLDYEGRYSHSGECVLFPSKDQRDWTKFRLPVKRGDIMMEIDGKCPFISSGKIFSFSSGGICGLTVSDCFKIGDVDGYWTDKFYIPASEEVKKKLFDKMAEAGYRWNVDTLELEKIEPKFKEGDILVDECNRLTLYTGVTIDNRVQTCADLNNTTLIIYQPSLYDKPISALRLATKEERNKFYSSLVKEGYKYDKEQHGLVKQKFKPFEKVLVRNLDTDEWLAGFFEKFDKSWNNPYHIMNLYHRTDFAFKQCIPYEGNEYLLGTTNDIKN